MAAFGVGLQAIYFPAEAQADLQDLLDRIARIETLQRTLSRTPTTEWKTLVADLKAETAEYAAAATRLRAVIGISDASAESDEPVATPEMTGPPDGVVVPEDDVLPLPTLERCHYPSWSDAGHYYCFDVDGGEWNITEVCEAYPASPICDEIPPQ